MTTLSSENPLPAINGETIQTEDGYKLWEYVASENSQPNSVGRWSLLFDLSTDDGSGSGGGSGGGTGANLDTLSFVGGNAIESHKDQEQIIGGQPVIKVHTNLDIETLPSIESRP